MSTVDYDTFLLAQNEASQLAMIERGLAMLGFDCFDYIQRCPSPFTTSRYHHLGTIPEALIRLDERHLIHDTIIPAVMQRKADLIWELKDFYAIHPELAARNHQNFYGLFAPGTNLQGNTSSVLTLIRLNRPITHQELNAKLSLYRLLIYAVQHMCQLILARRHREQLAIELTARQTDILKWIADGKTNDDIAHILGISSHTVNYHTKQILDKTSTQSRHDAAMRAFIAGIIPS
ncbi:hypothetical protein CAP48_14140 [Advenella sp. S44]|uniref:helix-turn-helix transcriptional regulator n=1 Tax=Advenella sp. S44 TaxID=1982755 RepID=UPI000C29AAB1|nr:LuxR family transcriptional regulator [Advenella sp. S44]PJX22087.1 hypothetical protein CAP48_14140 [Advenella sp. S44]